MPDTPDDLPRPPRRSTALPPFFAPTTPRTSRSTTPVEKSELPRRRTSQLFTPPSVPRRTRETPAVTPPSSPSTPSTAEEPRAEQEQAPASPAEALPSPTPVAASPSRPESMRIEQLEQPPIDLVATGNHPAVGGQSIEPIDYSESSRLHDAPEGGPPAPALEIERTELTFEAPTTQARLEVETFWAAESMFPGAAPSSANTERAEAAEPPLETERTPDDALTVPSDRVAPMEGIELGAMVGGAATIEEPPVESRDRDDTREAIELPSWLSEEPVQPARGIVPPAEPEPEPQAVPAETSEAETASAESYQAEITGEMAGDATAVEIGSSNVPAEALGESDRGAVIDEMALGAAILGEPRPEREEEAERPASAESSRDAELVSALAWPDAGAAPDDAYALMVGESADLGGVGEELRAASRAISSMDAVAASAAVAAALERIASRIRAGELDLPREAASTTDESALALTLAALLRAGPRVQ